MSNLMWSTNGKQVRSYFSIPGLTPEIEEVITRLGGLGAYLAGSRSKLAAYQLSEDTDWDLQIGVKDDPLYIEDTVLWGDSSLSPTPLSEYIRLNFSEKPSDEYEVQNDKTLHRVWVHNSFPSITVITRGDIFNWKRMWDKITSKFFYDYLWKSHPKVKILTPPEFEEWRRRVADYLNQAYDIAYVPGLSEYE